MRMAADGMVVCEIARQIGGVKAVEPVARRLAKTRDQLKPVTRDSDAEDT